MGRAQKRAHAKISCEKHVVTRLQGWIIDYLYEAGSPVCQKEIEAEFTIRHSTVSKTLNIMESAGIITRTVQAEDARYRLISLTEKARKNHPLAAQEFQIAETKATEGISEQDLNTFLLVAGKIIENLDK